MIPRQQPDDTNPSQLRHFGLDLRSGEARYCWLLFAIHFLVLTFHFASQSVRQSTYIDSLGAAQLPFVYLLVAIFSYPVLLFYGRLVNRYPLHRLILVSAVVVAGNLVLFWWWFGSGAPWVSVAFYLWVSIVGLLQVSQFWSYASLLLDARQAKRLFGFIGAGGLLGGIAGGQIARWISEISDTRSVLLVAAAVMLVMTLLVAWCGQDGPRTFATRRYRTPVSASVAGASTDEGETGIEFLAQVRDGFGVVRRSKYLQLISALIFPSAMVAQVIDLQFAWVIQTQTASLSQRTAVFGNFYSVVGLGAFAFQMLFTARIHRRLGVGFALRVLPVTNGVGSLIFGAAALLFPAFVLPAVWLMKIADNGLRYSLDQASRELLFLPVPSHQQAQAKAFIDVFVQRVAKGVAASLLLLVSIGWITAQPISPDSVWIRTAVVSISLILVWLTLTWTAQQQYVAAVRQILPRREFEIGGELEIEETTSLEVLVEGLGSVDTREVLRSLELLSVHGRGRLVPPIMLQHREVEVRKKVLEILQAEKRRDTTPFIETRLADESLQDRNLKPGNERKLKDPTTLGQMRADNPHRSSLTIPESNSLSLEAQRLFVSYSHDDEDLRGELEKHLALLEREGIVCIWHDRKIGAGEEWRGQIDSELEAANVILLMVSASFIASDYCWDVETTRALERHARGEVCVIPILVRACDWRTAPFAEHQVLPTDAEPVEEWKSRNAAWADVVTGLRRVIKEQGVRSKQPPSGVRGTREPRYPDDESRHLSLHLKDLFLRRKEIAIAGESTHAIEAEILDVRRQLRQGPQLRPGEFLHDGRLELLEAIGQGGFATVWKAWDAELEELVAVKVLHGHYSEDRRKRERLFRGARQMAQLSHPHVVRLLETELSDGGWRFFIMEYVGGGNFEQAVLRGKLVLEARLRVILQVGDALELAHRRGMVHRDIKPSNILLDDNLQAKLTDFDLVRAADTTGLTATRAMMGTVQFAAPEALDSAGTVGFPADVYSLGSTAVFAIRGERLPPGYYRTPGAVIADLPCAPEVAEVLRKATAFEAEERYSSAKELCSDLAAVLPLVDTPRRSPRDPGVRLPSEGGPRVQ